ncbi:MAG: pyrimidine dimer DNA glycosylase/endonuclease V [Xanthomonadales bacterium]|nr:pyrimidine dimer DNA glycosylase/endonuclease V [Xanthomonadales bacterium]
MRLWSLHPRWLDAKGLVALWREALLAKAVLAGRTRGYQQHPQLQRFREQADPLAAIDAYLHAVHDQARQRGYRFDAGKLGPLQALPTIAVSDGQIAHEWRHLRAKLAVRSPDTLARWADTALPDCHPLFHVEAGNIASWERVAAS